MGLLSRRILGLLLESMHAFRTERNRKPFSFLLGFCLLQSCLARSFSKNDERIASYAQGNFKMESEGLSLRVPEESPEDPYMGLRIRPVSLKYFERELKKVKSYHDILRIFYKENLSNDAIDSILMTQPYPSVYMARPKIADVMSYQADRTSPEGIYYNLMMGDSPVNCEKCTGISASHNLRQTASSSHTVRHHKNRKKGKRRKKDKKKGRKRDKAKNKKNRKRKGKKKKGKGRKKKKEMKKATDHLLEMKQKATCSNPVPSIIHISDISTAPNKKYYPECTIVYKCRKDSGCCRDTDECAANKTTTVTKYFLVMEFKSNQTVQGAKVEKFEFENHTECGCRLIKKSLPRCLRCPHPFELRRINGTECACECFDGQRTCIQISKGEKKLPKQENTCVRRSQCHRPNCKFGDFDSEFRLCPRQEDAHAQADEDNMSSLIGSGIPRKTASEEAHAAKQRSITREG